MKMRTSYNFVVLSSLFISNIALAAPDGGQVVAGSANISQAGNITTINQSTPSAVINWHGFDTTSKESVNFNQPNANSTVLNRITSGLPTNFAGTLNANGKVFIVNPAGMVFTKDSKINTSSFIATTADIKNNDFMKGNYTFSASPGSGNASIINNGEISADDGVVALIAPNVINSTSGYIAAYEDDVVLASGVAYTLDFNKDHLITFDVGSAIKNGYVQNKGLLYSMMGCVYMKTNTVEKILDHVVNTANANEATTAIVNANGEVVLSGTVEVGDVIAPSTTVEANNGILIDGINYLHQSFSMENPDGGSIHIIISGRSEELSATTTSGNITLDNAGIYTHNLSLSAPKGFIKEEQNSVLNVEHLNTLSATGTYLPSKDNYISSFKASNTVSGGIYLRHYGEMSSEADIGQAAGGQKIDEIGFWGYYFGSPSKEIAPPNG